MLSSALLVFSVYVEALRCPWIFSTVLLHLIFLHDFLLQLFTKFEKFLG
jgi:hypothetical protein